MKIPQTKTKGKMVTKYYLVTLFTGHAKPDEILVIKNAIGFVYFSKRV